MSGSPNDTIFALSSAPGRAGVSVFRVSGADAQKVTKKLSKRACPAPRYAALRKLYSKSGGLIDEALVLWMPGPKSFTGEDCAEFQVHGSPSVIEAMASAFLSLG
ncbi:tRNA uridine-5-carboxymethylaminomethyl(34) synthesis GTPase MnmE, partial [Hellea sp.]|nr:tRNA uridine-5-carboxymethylaminomethyl(34) synthesis GTPase MnmE [Hellea sp.]